MPKIEVEYYPDPNYTAPESLTEEEIDWIYQEIENFIFYYAQNLLSSESFRERGQLKEEKPDSVAEVLFVPSDEDFPYSSLILFTDGIWSGAIIEEFRVHFAQRMHAEMERLKKELNSPLFPLKFNILLRK